MDKQIEERLTFTVIYHQWLSRDKHGDDTYATPVNMLCYRYEKLTTVRNVRGEIVQATTVLYFDGLLQLNDDDKFEWDGRQFPLTSYTRYDGLEAGTGTTAVYL